MNYRISLSLLAAVLTAASSTGALDGTVTDPSGAVVPWAKVTVSGDHVTRTVSAGQDGHYTVQGLPPGRYRTRIHAAGFASYDRSDVMVSAGRVTEVDAPLLVGSAKQEITVKPGRSSVSHDAHSPGE